MEVGFGRGVGRKGNGTMRERMKTEEKMRWNTMTLEFESRPCNESFARVSAAAFILSAAAPRPLRTSTTVRYATTVRMGARTPAAEGPVTAASIRSPCW